MCRLAKIAQGSHLMNIHIDPIRRNLKFGLPKHKVLNWNADGLHITQFFNTLSIFFPAGERFFIQSVRNYRQEINAKQLQAQISAFIGQEGFHTREHEEYNDALAEAGMPIEQMDRFVVNLLDVVKQFPRPFQLAVTIGLEHLTAVLGDMLLSNEFLLDDAEEHFGAIWKWHAIEETEHKSVCYDAYEQVIGKGPKAYVLRISAFVAANAIFWSVFWPFYIAMLYKSGGLINVNGWLKLTNLLIGKPGIMRRVLPDWFDFFRPGFHPWMHDNREFLKKAETLMDQVANFSHLQTAVGKQPVTLQTQAIAGV